MDERQERAKVRDIIADARDDAADARDDAADERDRIARERDRAADERAERGKADFIAALLPVLDNLQRATEAAESGSTQEQIGEGVRRTAASFESALAAAGVAPIESVGQEFDPELHDAVETVPVEPEEEGKVVAEYTRGYRVGDRLLRPARVKVGRSSETMRTAGE